MNIRFLALLLLIVSLSGYALAEENKINVSPIVFNAPAQVEQNHNTSHDYVLQKVSLSGDYSYTRPGRSVTPQIIVHNQGEDDTAPGNVPVDAWFGDTILIPVVAEFTPIKGGTSAMYTLR